MDLEFTTKQVESQPVLGIRTSAKMSELGEVLGSLFGEVYGHITGNGQVPAGMPFSRYHSMEGESVDLECGIPVTAQMEGKGRISSGELPGGTVATVTLMGPYEGLPQAWSALVEWIGSEGLQPAGPPWEVYVTDPGAEPDQSKWRTDIFFPVR